MLKKSVLLASALAGLAITTPQASAQQGSYWSYDGQSSYASYSACEEARKTRTLGGAAIGGLLGAGLGTAAGGDDTRNAVIGSVVGAVAGGMIGQNQVKCEQTYAPVAQSNYRATEYVAYTPRTTTYQTSTRYYGQGQYGQGQQSGYYPSQPQPRYYSQTTSYGYGQPQPSYGYNNQQRYGYAQPAPRPYHNANQTYYPQQQQGYGQRTVTYQQTSYQQSSNWTYDGQTLYRSYDECERAKNDRTLASGAVGALVGAGLGTLAGGDDGRNAAIGAVAGGVTGAYAGNRSIQCYQASSVYRR